ncbi:MAG: trans-acting regulatory protein HvrA [Pseudomonadota bacterium]
MSQDNDSLDAPLDLRGLPLSELQALLQKTDEAIHDRREEELKVLVDGFVKKLQSLGLPIDEAIAVMKLYLPGKAARVKREPRDPNEFILYANPADPRQTWGGQGRRPEWARAHIERGGELEGPFCVCPLKRTNGSTTPKNGKQGNDSKAELADSLSLRADPGAFHGSGLDLRSMERIIGVHR